MGFVLPSALQSHTESTPWSRLHLRGEFGKVGVTSDVVAPPATKSRHEKIMNKVTPEPAEILPQELESIKKRFFAKVDKDGPIPAHKPELGKCWNWTAAKGWTGYASFHIKQMNEQ